MIRTFTRMAINNIFYYYHSARVSLMIVLCNSKSIVTCNVQICALPAIDCIWQYCYLFACNVGERDIYNLQWCHFQLSQGHRIDKSSMQVPILNSKFMTWLCYVLYWSWSLRNVPSWDKLSPLPSFYGDWEKVSSYTYSSCFISYASHEQFNVRRAIRCMLLSTCDVIFTWSEVGRVIDLRFHCMSFPTCLIIQWVVR